LHTGPFIGWFCRLRFFGLSSINDDLPRRRVDLKALHLDASVRRGLKGFGDIALLKGLRSARHSGGNLFAGACRVDRAIQFQPIEQLPIETR
jgi:hypothetical protein